MGERLICGFRQDTERDDGELDFVLYFGTNVGRPVRTLFQGLFESFLARRNLSVSLRAGRLFQRSRAQSCGRA